MSFSIVDTRTTLSLCFNDIDFASGKREMNMGLLTKEVEVNITSRNVEYFENLGYTIPRVYDKGKHKYIFKKGTTIIVKVSDLRKNSMRNVNIECDNCHTIIT